MGTVEIVGRSSSHFTRTARIFALELGVPHTFRPVFDILAVEAENYADNPALKVPILVLPEGPLFGTENICRELARRSERGSTMVLRGAVPERLVANAEELTLHVMANEVTLILAKVNKDERLAPPKVRQSLANSLAYLDTHLDRVLDLLPRSRNASFFEVGLFSTITHLPFREILDVTAYTKLSAFSRRFGERTSAKQTEYRFDKP